MDNDRLRSIISKLNRELDSADSVDEQTRTFLRELVVDVEKLAGDADAEGIESDTTAGQLENAALRFESEHPKLSMAIGEVIDALGKLGI